MMFQFFSVRIVSDQFTLPSYRIVQGLIRSICFRKEEEMPKRRNAIVELVVFSSLMPIEKSTHLVNLYNNYMYMYLGCSSLLQINT